MCCYMHDDREVACFQSLQKGKTLDDLSKTILIPCSYLKPSSIQTHLLQSIQRQSIRMLYSISSGDIPSVDLLIQCLKVMTTLLSHDSSILYSLYTNEIITLLYGCIYKMPPSIPFHEVLEGLIALVAASFLYHIG